MLKKPGRVIHGDCSKQRLKLLQLTRYLAQPLTPQSDTKTSRVQRGGGTTPHTQAQLYESNVNISEMETR